jgi:hypothetical protein
VSTEASACPHCGVPSPDLGARDPQPGAPGPKAVTDWVLAVVWDVMICVVAGGIFGCGRGLHLAMATSSLGTLRSRYRPARGWEAHRQLLDPCAGRCTCGHNVEQRSTGDRWWTLRCAVIVP